MHSFRVFSKVYDDEGIGIKWFSQSQNGKFV